MTTRAVLLLVPFLAPLLVRAGTLDTYGTLTGKTILSPSAMPTLADLALSDLPPDKTSAIASIERGLAEQGIVVIQDGPHFVRLFPREARDSLTNAPLRGAELAGAKRQETLPDGIIDFTGADLRQALEIYGELSRRTVLHPATLPAPTITLKTRGGLTWDEGIYALATVLALNGIALVDDGTKFVQVVPMAQRAQVKTGAPEPAPGAKPIPFGSIDFAGADLDQALAFYAATRQRTVLRARTLPAPTITLKTRGQLTQEEVLYAVATVLALDGISVVDDGTSFVQMVPTVQRSAVQAHAPKAEPGAKLFDPKKVPSMGVSSNHWPLTETERLEQELEQLRKAFYEFMHLSDPAKRPSGRLLNLYAGLASKRAVPSKDFDGLPVWFHVETPLTRSELLYAIETTFVLNGLAIIPVDDHRVRLGRLVEVMRRVGNHLEYPQPKR
jgi:hypothetical protein